MLVERTIMFGNAVLVLESMTDGRNMSERNRKILLERCIVLEKLSSTIMTFIYNKWGAC